MYFTQTFKTEMAENSVAAVSHANITIFSVKLWICLQYTTVQFSTVE